MNSRQIYEHQLEYERKLRAAIYKEIEDAESLSRAFLAVGREDRARHYAAQIGANRVMLVRLDDDIGHLENLLVRCK